MGDSYKHEPDGVATTISGLKDIISEYSNKIHELTVLVNEIGSSSAWRDMQVKPAFISTANSYIETYKSVCASMEAYVNYLTNKSESASALEDAFSRG